MIHITNDNSVNGDFSYCGWEFEWEYLCQLEDVEKVGERKICKTCLKALRAEQAGKEE